MYTHTHTHTHTHTQYSNFSHLTNTCLPEVNEIWDVSELFREWPLFPEREFKDLASASISLESEIVQIQPNLMQIFIH